LTTSIPASANTASNEAANCPAWLRTTNRYRLACSPRSATMRSRACCVVQGGTRRPLTPPRGRARRGRTACPRRVRADPGTRRGRLGATTELSPAGLGRVGYPRARLRRDRGRRRHRAPRQRGRMRRVTALSPPTPAEPPARAPVGRTAGLDPVRPPGPPRRKRPRAPVRCDRRPRRAGPGAPPPPARRSGRPHPPRSSPSARPPVAPAPAHRPRCSTGSRRGDRLPGTISVVDLVCADPCRAAGHPAYGCGRRRAIK